MIKKNYVQSIFFTLATLALFPSTLSALTIGGFVEPVNELIVTPTGAEIPLDLPRIHEVALLTINNNSPTAFDVQVNFTNGSLKNPSNQISVPISSAGLIRFNGINDLQIPESFYTLTPSQYMSGAYFIWNADGNGGQQRATVDCNATLQLYIEGRPDLLSGVYEETIYITLYNGDGVPNTMERPL